MVQEKNDIKQAMEFLKECPSVKIEDILPFFPDFVTIDHFKVCHANLIFSVVHHEHTPLSAPAPYSAPAATWTGLFQAAICDSLQQYSEHIQQLKVCREQDEMACWMSHSSLVCLGAVH